MEKFDPNQKLMALSWKQPYAELMLHGKIETRTWNTNYRGWVLICTSLKSYNTSQILSISGGIQFKRLIKVLQTSNDEVLNHPGKAIAIGKLIDCRPMIEIDEDSCFVKFYPDLFCHIYDNIVPINPFNWKGSQGWKEVDFELKQKIEILIPEFK
jgi:hypothetical protein